MPGDLFNLSESEQAFFNTGELPADLAAEHTASQVPAAIETPVIAAPTIETPAAPSESEQALESLRQSLAQEQQQRLYLQAQLDLKNQPPKPVEVVPDETTDPLGAMMHQLAKINGTVQELQTKLLQQRQETEQQNQLQQFTSSMHNLRDEFIAKQPDFPAAYNHLRETRIADLKAIGIPQTEINQALLRDEFIIAQTATQQGKNPAQVLYEMSKRHGYSPVKQVPQPATKIANLRSGQEAAKTITPTSAPIEDITMESIANLSDSDLNKLILSDAAWQKMSGKPNDIFGH